MLLRVPVKTKKIGGRIPKNHVAGSITHVGVEMALQRRVGIALQQMVTNVHHATQVIYPPIQAGSLITANRSLATANQKSMASL
jgi:ribosomal protein S7